MVKLLCGMTSRISGQCAVCGKWAEDRPDDHMGICVQGQ